jgi:hypothetical protein
VDEPSCPRSRDIDRHDEDIRQIRKDYVLREVYQAALDRIAALEARSSNAWLSNRNALLAVASMIAGIIWSAYIAKGR